MTNTDKPCDLDDYDLDAARGGGQVFPQRIKAGTIVTDGKSDHTRASGGFSDVSGLGTEITVAEYR